MKNFTFHNPTKIIFGEGTIASLDAEVPRDARVLITSGGGSIKHNGVLAQVQEALGERATFVFSGIEPNPTYETLMQACAMAREHDIDFLLAVGGGSVIDGTKFIAAALKFEGEPWDILSKGAPVRDAMPFGSVLTLPAHGFGDEQRPALSATARKATSWCFPATRPSRVSRCSTRRPPIRCRRSKSPTAWSMHSFTSSSNT